MYNVNKLMRKVLITPAEVLFHAPTKHILDIRMIEQSIIVAEERFIRPELGYDLYAAIVEEKNVEVTVANQVALQALVGSDQEVAIGDYVNALEYLSASYLSLWKQHLWKLIAECVITSSYPEGFVQLGSEGATHNNPPAGLMVTSGFVTPLLSSMKWSIDKKVKDRISPLLQAMHNFICRSKADYILYTQECPDCAGTDRLEKYTGIALDLYDDDEKRNCCDGSSGWLNS